MKVMNIYLLLTLCIAATGARGAALSNDAAKLQVLKIKEDNETLPAQQKEGENECAVLEHEQAWRIGQMASNAAKAVYTDHPELPESLRQAMANELEAMYAKSTSVGEIRSTICGQETTKIVNKYKNKATIVWKLMTQRITDFSTEKLKSLVQQYGLVKGPAGQTLLIEAAIAGNKPVMQWLLDDMKVDVDEQGAQGTTAFLEAARMYESMVKNNTSSEDGIKFWRKHVLFWLKNEKKASGTIRDKAGLRAFDVLADVIPQLQEAKRVDDVLKSIQPTDESVATVKPAPALASEPKSEPTKKEFVLAVTAKKLTSVSSPEKKKMTKQEQLRAKLSAKRQAQKKDQETITREALAKQQQEAQEALAKKQQKAVNTLAHEVALAQKARNKEKNAQKHSKEFAKYLQRQGITSPASKHQSTE